jgi:outer membrane protein OmpA-like peptidoglycan-associated protein
MKLRLICVCAVPVLLLSTAVCAQEDIDGASDHPKVPRIEGTFIVGHDYTDFDEGVFVREFKKKELITDTAEGKRTRIVYRGPDSISTLGILRNYQKALADLGNVTEIFSCRNESCPVNLGEVFIWSDSNQLKTPFNESSVLYDNPNYISDQSYWYASVKSANTFYSVSLYSAERSNRTSYMGKSSWPSLGQHLIHLEIVESDEFEATLEFVEAKEIASSITETGHIALYGIQFDFDSDALKPDSAPVLEEIAKAMAETPGLKLYVVGHSDNEGTLQYNQDLSTRRAKSVVTELTSHHGIESGRLVALGVGPAAPVASNDSEDGRALNRRVELVKR